MSCIFTIIWFQPSTRTLYYDSLNQRALTRGRKLPKKHSLKYLSSWEECELHAPTWNERTSNNSKSWQALGSHHHFIFIQNFVEPFWKRNYVLVRNDWILKVSLNVVQLYLKTSDLLSTCVFGKFSRNKTSL